MKLSLKLVFITVICAVLFAACCILSGADDDGEFAYSIRLADGTVTEYQSSVGFSASVSSAPTGAVVTLGSSIEISDGIRIWGTETERKEITIDLAGYGIYSTSKSLVATMIGAKDYATINVTSSKPDAFLYMIDVATGSTQGGNIFSSIGVDALINVGGCVLLDGVRYPGSNISTFSSCFADARENASVDFPNGGSINCDGGQHFANVADWLGFITPRSGNGTVTIKNADILVDQNNTLIHSEDSSSKLYLENCLIVRLDGTAKHMFNQIHSSVVIKNCITNYSFVAQNAASAGVVTLEGNNVFGAGLGFSPELLADGEGKVAARTNVVPELAQGGKEFWRYDNAGRFNKLSESLPEFGDAYSFVAASETFSCTWEYDGGQKKELWIIGSDPTPPVKASATGNDGMYKKGWLKTYDKDGTVVIKLTNVNDFSIKVQAEYDGSNLCYRIYAPAFIFDEAYISYSEGRIDGAGFSSGDWEKAEVDGESYYVYTTMNIEAEDIDRVVEISIPCDMLDGNKLVKTEGVYRITLSKYLKAIREGESECSAEQLELVRELEDKYFHSED